MPAPTIAAQSSPPDHRLSRWELTPTQRLKTAIKAMFGFSGVRPVKIAAGPARGVEMVLDFSGHTPLYLGMYEMELHRFTACALAAAKLAFDVGGYIGYDALLFANCSGARVVTFEPDPERLPLLQDNVKRNPRLASRIQVEPLAVSAAGDTSLDALSERLGIPEFVKIDIDGGEAAALRGAAALLRTHRPNVIVETHSLALERECGALLSEYGYRPIVKHNRRVWREFRGLAEHNRWLLAAGAKS